MVIAYKGWAEYFIPKLFIHSPEDEIVHYEHGMKLFEQAGEQKKFLMIAGGHNERFLLSGDAYVNALKSSLSRYFPLEWNGIVRQHKKATLL